MMALPLVFLILLLCVKTIICIVPCTQNLNRMKFKLKLQNDYNSELVKQNEEILQSSATTAVEQYFKMYSQAKESNDGIVLRECKSIGSNAIKKTLIPSRRLEAWRYTNVNALFNIKPDANINYYDINYDIIKDYIDAECMNSYIVIVDGKLSLNLSNIKNLDTTKVKINNFDNNILINKYISYENIPDIDEINRNSFGSDIISSLNLLNINDLTHIDVTSDANIMNPLQLLFVSTSNSNNKFNKLIINMGANSNLKLKQSYVSANNDNSKDNILINSCTDINLASNSNLVHTYIQNLNNITNHLEVINSNVNSNSNYDLTILQSGSSINRINSHIKLKESNANCTLNGIILADSQQSLDIHSSITHDAPNCFSRQKQHNVVNNNGEAIFKGRIRIPKHAQFTDSDQLCKTLMLGKNSKLIAMPTLEIIADNVVCSHGASVTDLDENSMFYLQSRGLSRREGKKLLLRSFALTLLEKNVVDKNDIDRIIFKIDQMYSNDDISNSSFEPNQGTEKKYLSI